MRNLKNRRRLRSDRVQFARQEDDEEETEDFGDETEEAEEDEEDQSERPRGTSGSSGTGNINNSLQEQDTDSDSTAILHWLHMTDQATNRTMDRPSVEAQNHETNTEAATTNTNANTTTTTTNANNNTSRTTSSHRHVRIQAPASANTAHPAGHRRSFSWSSSPCSSSQSPLEPGAVSAEEEDDRNSSDYSSQQSPRSSTENGVGGNGGNSSSSTTITSAFRQIGSSFAGKTDGSTYSNYSDLAARLRNGLRANEDSEKTNDQTTLRRSQSELLRFDENVVGTDVVLCVHEDPNGHGAAFDSHGHGRTPPSPSPSLSSLASLSPVPSFTLATTASSSIIPTVTPTPPTPVSAATPPPSTIQHSSSSSSSDVSTTGKPTTVVTRLYAHRFLLAASSEPFRVMLTGRMREANENEVHMYDLCAAVVKKMLGYIYTGEVTVTMDDVVETLMAAEMYELAGLKEICKSFVLKNAQEVFTGDRIVRLPEKLLLEIVQDDNLQIREVVLLDALVTWGQARATSTGGPPVLDILQDLMEHVRFPTMSVNDLYGKVRPLAQEGVLRESLLTEALFHHLKWGLHAGKASERSRPRALATQLRKRKRVSFFQHVSFLPQ